MSRLIDQAADLETMQREIALKNLQVAHQQTAAFSAFECEDCGDPIPQARREAVLGCQTCIECQTQRERYAQT